mmetsp:Transcript_19251/g.24818  ORF Transcript_19251/g.24818 Transcript_19251/m.24818 type:complete len:392 (+) Transcript_19251:118-1293(+)|eukprot:CAMPEP_0198147890 /NCGR_PEP_ID=MMETSP1443-20131203/38372_1 /TAXON_ID=186043 /ORGANISM="Entomoneis sp., Strain CCMP2396" /LENGTH=391 /DNA_ID=CAMNT_0043812407 /DNA_START=46 /DNA_END=1221 /DNA_ORIENTATION=-
MAEAISNSGDMGELPEIPEAKTLPDPPTDCISKLSFLSSSSSSSSSSILASSSWDGGLKLHDCSATAMECKLSHTAGIGPLLSLAAVDEEYIFVGGLNGSILRINVANGGVVVEKVGDHPPPPKLTTTSQSLTASACSCLVALPSSPPLVASAGWHGQFHLWDLRQSTTSSGPAVSMDLPGKAFTMDTHESRVVIGCSGRRTCLLDIRRCGASALSSADSVSWTADSVLEAESSQKHQTRCMRFFPDGQSVAVGSVEGRVSVESVVATTGGGGGGTDNNNNTMKKMYAFKCHREGDLVYPVNCIDFHAKFGTFATGGCDGSVVVWDGENRKRLSSFKVPTSVAAMCFNHDGSQLAVASSYTFEDGEREHPRDEIYVRTMLDSECAPKRLTQ